MSKEDVHTRHCNYDGCKYGEELSGCTVYLGYKEPEYPRGKKPTKKEFDNRRKEAEINNPF